MCSELFSCNSFTVYSHNRQVENYLADLPHRDWLRFAAVAERLTMVLLAEAPAVDRIEKVAGASNKLYELKISPPGSNGPQQRVLCLVDGRKIVCLRGIAKRQPRLRPADVRAADKVAGSYLRAEHEPGRRGRRGKGPP
jgi:hypothetical protein